MKKNYYRCIIVILFLSSIGFGCSDPIDISSYKGDGKIYHIGNKYAYPGFVVDLGAIDLSKQFSKEYKMINTPKIEKSYTIGFVFDEKEHIEKTPYFSYGNLFLEAKNGNGKILFSFSSRLQDWMQEVTTTPGENIRDYFLYFRNHPHESSFTLNEAEPMDVLSLYVSYTPPAGSFNEKAIINLRMRVGGSK